MQIHYDGWPEEYDVWLEDSSTEIHPATWCAKTGHPLTLPLSKLLKNISTSGTLLFCLKRYNGMKLCDILIYHIQKLASEA